MSKRALILALTLWFIASCSQPQSQDVKAFVKGSFIEIQQQYQGQPYLVMFWSEDCAYCMKELALFGQLLKQHADMNLITVATDPFLDDDIIRQKLASFGLQQVQAWVFSEPFVETLYFDVDRRWRGALPLTFMFDADNNKTKKMGIVDQDTLTAWLIDNKVRVN